MTNVPCHLACEFLEAYSRFEYALKRVKGYCRTERHGSASADWKAFRQKAAKALEDQLRAEGRFDEAKALLVDDPPKKEVVRDGVAVFEDAAKLPKGAVGEQLVEAVRRVRNNHVHGGKHQEERYPGHDRALVEQSLVVLRALKEIASSVVPGIHGHLFD